MKCPRSSATSSFRSRWTTALLVVLLGFIGGVLSGFIGSGGAFFMTPGMMNLGVSGVVAVGSNITHKFGKALVGARKHAQMGNVDKRLAMFLLVTALVGIRLAVWINSLLFAGGRQPRRGKSAGSDLYISAIFIGVPDVRRDLDAARRACARRRGAGAVARASRSSSPGSACRPMIQLPGVGRGRLAVGRSSRSASRRATWPGPSASAASSACRR